MCAAAAHGKLQDWKDFPKGLHILVAISDTNDCNEITDTLQSCDYAVTAFTRGEDALAAIQSPHTTFHAAMVDATSGNGFDGFKILEAVHELPVIMISSTEDIGSMMRAITLGAADFLQKPFSEEKLRNIWQHVARKAMLEPSAACEQEQCLAETFDNNTNMESQIQSFDGLHCTMGESFGLSDSNVEQSGATAVKAEMAGNDELLQGKLEDLEEEFMNTNLEFCNPCSIKLELDESLDDINLGDGIVLDGDGGSDFDLDPSIFVGFPDSDSDSALDFNFDHLETTPDSEIDIEEAKMLAQVLKVEDTTCNISESSESMSITSTKDKGEEETKPERTVKSSKCAQGRKKTKVDWTPELHQKFVQAVEQLGVDKAIPSRILELMGVKCLTRHNIASHLQKYRSHRKHLLLREAEAAANWNHRRHSDSSVWAKTKRDGASWPTPIQPRHPPILPAPPSGVPLVVWGHPTIDPSSAHMWQQPPISPPAAWQAPDGTVWQHPAAYMPPWGHAPAPVYHHSCMRVPVYGVPQQPVPPAGPGDGLNAPSCHPPREVVDAVISEGLTNPCTLPLGLKPPSMESVMSELVRQGINITPPTPS